jgi:predicted nucleotidyltransferase
MQRDEVIRILQRHRDELAQEYGVVSLSLFGSVARDKALDASDIDLLVEFDDRPISLFHLGGLQQALTAMLGAKDVDLTLRDSLVPALSDRILEEAIDVI